MSEQNNMSAKALLAEVNKAIVAVTVGGQSYKIGSRNVTRANLTELKKLREELMAEAAANDNTNSGILRDTYVAVFDGR